MAADGLHDDDGLDYLSEHIGRAGSRLDRPDPGPLDREQSYNELRASSSFEARFSVRESADGVDHAADGGWTWKGLELDPAANRVADEALAARRAAEGRDGEGNYAETGITPAMRQVEAELEHGTLVPDTERFALKSPDRFKEKLAKLISLEPDSPPTELAARIHDGVRYTFTFETQWYSDGVNQAERLLTERGFELCGRKPGWAGTEYKGINSQWRDTHGGPLFEIQFHTPDSWEAKQRTHDSYEKIDHPATPPEERMRLRVFQREVMLSVTVPPGALDFVPHRPRGG
jgi:hypothetical protein